MAEDDLQEGEGFDDDFELEFEEEAAAGSSESTDTVTLTKAEFENMRGNQGQLEKLADIISSRQQAPVNQVPQQVGETDEQFEARVAEEIFTPGKTKKLIDEIVARSTQPLVRQYESTIAELTKQVAINSGKYNGVLDKYGAEVDQLLATLTPAQRATSAAINWATDQVKLKHIDDIVAEQVAKKLAESSVAGGSSGKSAAFQRGNQGALAQGQTKVRVKQADYNAVYDEGLRLFGDEGQAKRYANNRLSRRA